MMQVLPHPADVNGHWRIKAPSLSEVAPHFAGPSLHQSSKGKKLKKARSQALSQSMLLALGSSHLRN